MHCKDVSMREVGIRLDAEHISELMKDWRAYVRTDSLILKNGDDYAIVDLVKKDCSTLIRDVVDFRIVSLPKDTVFVERPEMDVLNLPAMAALQSEFPGKAVIVRGMFSHISYVKDIVPVELNVVDNVPPSPSKLGVLVRMALASGFVNHPVVVKETIIDMADKISEVDTEAVMFPCRVSNLKADRPFYFLDDTPKVNEEVTLIGCNLSKRIYSEVYGSEPKFINVCPADHVDPEKRTIVKCCKVKTGHKLEGNVVSVPWGATVPEVVDAINALFSE